MDSGIYIHIPFCASRCIYCGFYSTIRHDLKSRYVEAVCKELELRKTYLDNIEHKGSKCRIDTVYIGGGTPSQLSAGDFRKIFSTIHSVFNGSPSETTVEINPDDMDEGLAEVLAECGVNRISMGAQTFNSERLKFLRRRHKASDIQRSIKILHDAGVNNISIDLMFGFPDESPTDFHEDVCKVIDLGVPHISAYSLMYEEGTPLYKMLHNGTVRQIDEEASLLMYASLIDTLEKNGYEHYEISNFAKPGFRSRHNSSYWKDLPYLGVGAAAHSYDRKSRQWNVADIEKYVHGIETGELAFETETIDEDTHYNDLVTTALRTREGLDLALLNDVYRKYAIDNAKTSIAAGLLRKEGERLVITRKGLFVSDTVMSDLIKI